MRKLFEEMPVLQNDRIIMREMTLSDAPALGDLINDRAVYAYLPTFLYEQQFHDPAEAIRRMRTECFDTEESILLGVFQKHHPGEMTGIAEIYAYDPKKNKASVGCRLRRRYWRQGIASEAVKLLMEYLKNDIQIRTITAHVMVHNDGSRRVVEKLGFVNQFPDLWEDWGREGPVLIHKYVCKYPENPKKQQIGN